MLSGEESASESRRASAPTDPVFRMEPHRATILRLPSSRTWSIWTIMCLNILSTGPPFSSITTRRTISKFKVRHSCRLTRPQDRLRASRLIQQPRSGRLPTQMSSGPGVSAIAVQHRNRGKTRMPVQGCHPRSRPAVAVAWFVFL